MYRIIKESEYEIRVNNLNNKIVKAAKWSAITEIVAKLITPITNMILARILAPEAFGVVATVTMIISFADMFTDAGFQKYIVQHEFKSEYDKTVSTNVAFWTNLIISLIIWLLIIMFSEKIAIVVGNPGLGNVIAISCIQLPLTSFSSIQMAVYRRAFDFKTLFLVRIIGICIPFFVTIPLAILGYSYWSLIIGSICGVLFNAVVLTLKSKWKPSLIYKLAILKEMLSFSMWSLIEAISIWFTVWIDSFIIALFLDQHYLGLYKTSTSMVNSIMSIITASAIPILFSALSRLQDNDKAFKNTFYKMQRCVAYLVLPMGVGIYIYRDLATKILLGEQWSEAGNIIGIWALTSVLVIIFSNFNSEVYRAKGKPKISFLSQIISLSTLIPVCLISLKRGFWIFVYARSLIRLQSIVVGFIIMKLVMDFSIIKMVKNIGTPLLCTAIMGTVSIVLKQYSHSIFFDIISIFICIFVYFVAMVILGKRDLENVKDIINNKNEDIKRVA